MGIFLGFNSRFGRFELGFKGLRGFRGLGFRV